VPLQLKITSSPLLSITQKILISKFLRCLPSQLIGITEIEKSLILVKNKEYDEPYNSVLTTRIYIFTTCYDLSTTFLQNYIKNMDKIIC